MKDKVQGTKEGIAWWGTFRLVSVWKPDTHMSVVRGKKSSDLIKETIDLGSLTSLSKIMGNKCKFFNN